MTRTAIELTKVDKRYPMGRITVQALKGISLSIGAGDFVAVAGPSGSGKTTIMNIIGLIDAPSAGSVRINGVETLGLPRRELTRLRQQEIGFIFQSFNLLPVLNVLENVELPLLVGKNRPAKQERREWIRYLLHEVGLSDRMNHRPSELSGGQQQRVAIARALATKPRVVIADEPTANLDSKTGERILELMRRVNRDQGTTFVFSTHDPVIRELADHVVMLHDGEIEAEHRRGRGADT